MRLIYSCTKPFAVAVFSEGDYEGLTEFDTKAEANASAGGVRYGGQLYGAGSLHTYVLPDELDEIEEFESETAVRAFQRTLDGKPPE